MTSTHRPRTQSGRTVGPFTEGLLAAVAISAMSSSAAGGVDDVVPIAIGLGIVAAVFGIAGDWLSGIARWCYSAIALVAFIPAAVHFVRSNGCLPGPPPSVRFAVVALMVIIASLMVAASVLTMHAVPASGTGTALYGGLEILVTAGTFIAGGGGPPQWAAVATMIPLSAVLGWFLVRATDTVVAVAGAAFGMQSLYAAAADSTCGAPNYSGVVLIIVFGGAYFAARAVCAPFVGPR